MTLKIETSADDRVAILRLIGRVESEHVEALRGHIRSQRVRVMLDLEEVTLVDVSIVRLFLACEADGVELLNCPSYVREWMGREQR